MCGIYSTPQLMWAARLVAEFSSAESSPKILSHKAQSTVRGCVAHAQGDAHIDAAWNSTAMRTARIAEYVAEMAPGATVLVVGLLPRGDVTLHPNPDAFKLPSKCAPSVPTHMMCVYICLCIAQFQLDLSLIHI